MRSNITSLKYLHDVRETNRCVSCTLLRAIKRVCLNLVCIAYICASPPHPLECIVAFTQSRDNLVSGISPDVHLFGIANMAIAAGSSSAASKAPSGNNSATADNRRGTKATGQSSVAKKVPKKVAVKGKGYGKGAQPMSSIERKISSKIAKSMSLFNNDASRSGALARRHKELGKCFNKLQRYMQRHRAYAVTAKKASAKLPAAQTEYVTASVTTTDRQPIEDDDDDDATPCPPLAGKVVPPVVPMASPPPCFLKPTSKAKGVGEPKVKVKAASAATAPDTAAPPKASGGFGKRAKLEQRDVTFASSASRVTQNTSDNDSYTNSSYTYSSEESSAHSSSIDLSQLDPSIGSQTPMTPMPPIRMRAPMTPMPPRGAAPPSAAKVPTP